MLSRAARTLSRSSAGRGAQVPTTAR
jgi:hypothetical protein